MHALERIVASADLTRGRAVIVNAVDEAAVDFWRHCGFIPSPANRFQLLRSVQDVRAPLAASEG